MRLFLGLGIPSRLREGLAPVLSLLTKATPLENLHVMVKFLGEQDPEAVIERLRGLRSRSFTLETAGFARFPGGVWLSVEGAGVRELFAEVEDRLSGLVPRDRRGFCPHVTVARARQGVPEAAVDESWLVEELVLYRSTLTSEGPVYERLASFPLKHPYSK